MVELRAKAPLVLDDGWPGDDHSVARSAKVRCIALCPWKGRVHRPAPAPGIERIRGFRSDLVGSVFGVIERFGEAVQRGLLGDAPVKASFGRRAIVALDVNDQSVVELDRPAKIIDYSADLIIRKGKGRREGF